jgi:hypothetical protein
VSHDPQYVERLLNHGTGGTVNSLPERASVLLEKPDASIGFLLGKGLSPQEIMDVLECWWWQGHRFAKEHR